MKRLLFAIPSYAYLEPAFAAAGDFEQGVIERKNFPDGERYLRLLGDIDQRDVVLLGGTPTDADWLDVFDIACGIARGGARSLSIVMPYFGYSTMERAVLPGEVVVAKTRARLLSSIPAPEGGTHLYFFDLHTDGIEFYLDDRVLTRHVYGAPIITQKIAEHMGDTPFVLGACDAGRAKWVQSLARDLKVEPAFVYKKRDSSTGGTAVTGINADVKGKEVVVYDDMIRTGGSLVQAAKAYLAAGATKVHAIASHLVLPADSIDKIKASGALTSIMGTDSHPGSQKLPQSDLAPIAARLVSYLTLALLLAGCSKPATSAPDPAKVDAASTTAITTELEAGAPPITATAPQRFETAEEAFNWILKKDPLILAVGEAHAQKGTEAIASSTKRFTDQFLPLVASRSSDVVVELWAPDPKCMKEVKQVASAQAPVTSAQAATNQNEYVTLGTKSKDLGVTPWLLRPSCDEFAMLADAGADAVGAMLGLVKKLTQQKVTQLYEKQGQGSGPRKIVMAYGGALHNDMKPSEAMKDYTFGPDLDRLAGGRYIELDLIVPEYVKKTPTWEKLPWFASFEADRNNPALASKATLYTTGEKSFVLVFPATAK